MRRGSSYILVIIIMFTIFIMLSISISITRNEAKISFAYNENLNQYFFAIDFAEKFVSELNKVLDLQRNRIQREVIDDLVSNGIMDNIADYVYYEYEEDVYKGNFFLDNPNAKNRDILKIERNTLYTDLYMNKLNLALDTILRFNGGVYKQVYEVEVNDKEGLVLYEIVLSIIKSNNTYELTSTAYNMKTGNDSTVKGAIALTVDEHETIIYENYQFREIPDYVYKESFLTTEDLVSADIDMKGIEWSAENPIAYYEMGEEVDISEFYIGNDNVTTILILEGDNRIFSSIPEKNYFSGMLYSQDTPEISEDIEIEYNNNLLDIFIEDISLKRRLYDFFNLTDFKSDNVLKDITLSNDFSMEVTALPYYKIIKIVES